jgi:hypothetical protein
MVPPLFCIVFLVEKISQQRGRRRLTPHTPKITINRLGMFNYKNLSQYTYSLTVKSPPVDFVKNGPAFGLAFFFALNLERTMTKAGLVEKVPA